MPVAATERPRDREEPTLLEEAERLAERNPGYRVEILGGDRSRSHHRPTRFTPSP